MLEYTNFSTLDLGETVDAVKGALDRIYTVASLIYKSPSDAFTHFGCGVTPGNFISDHSTIKIGTRIIYQNYDDLDESQHSLYVDFSRFLDKDKCVSNLGNALNAGIALSDALDTNLDKFSFSSLANSLITNITTRRLVNRIYPLSARVMVLASTNGASICANSLDELNQRGYPDDLSRYTFVNKND